MRTIMNGPFVPSSFRTMVATVALVALLAAGCSEDRDDTTGLPPATGEVSSDIFIDSYAPVVIYRGFEDSKYDAVQIERNPDDVFAGTASLRVTVPEPSAEPPWFAGGAFTNEWGRDLSGFNAVTFYVKSPRPTTLNEVGFGLYYNDNPGSESSRYMATATNIPMTRSWEKHVIAIPDPSKLTMEAGLFWFSEGYEGAGYKFWIDELKYENVAGIRNPRPTMRTETISAFAGAEIIPQGTQVTFEVDGEDQLITHGHSYFNFTSDDESVVRIEPDGTIRAVGNGTATVTATLDTTDVLGEITVNSTAPPTGPAPPPTLPESQVISVFSDVYTNVEVATWMATWASGELTDIKIDGDAVKAYTGLGFAAIEIWGAPVVPINADSMNYFHTHVWAPGGTTFIVKLVDFGADGVPGGIGENVDSEHPVTLNAGTTPPFTTGSWVSLDIPMSDFTGLRQTAHIAQIIYEGVSTVLVDNIYFHK